MEIDSNLQSHFLNLYTVALSDTEVDTEELEFLYKFGEERGIKKDKIDYIIENPHKVRFNVPENIFEKVEHLYDFAYMIIADNRIDPREIDIFKKLCKRYRFKEENIPDIIEFLLEEAKKETNKEKIFNIVENDII